MAEESSREFAGETMRRINRAWLDGRVDDMAPLIHPEIVIALPGFAERMQGREILLGGFRDFCQNARIHEFRDGEYQVDTVDDTAVVSFPYEMVYERSGKRYSATGRDLWVFQKLGTAWIAVWRAMLDMTEHEL